MLSVSARLGSICLRTIENRTTYIFKQVRKKRKMRTTIFESNSGDVDNVSSKASELLNRILLFQSDKTSSVIVGDIPSTKQKLIQLIAGGCNSFEIVTDFDHTMSKFSHDGKIVPSCHGIFEMDPELSESTKSTLKQLRIKYYPIEMDPHKSEEEKIPDMLNWWEASHEAIIDCGIHRSTLAKTVRESDLSLREKVPEFLKLLNFHNVPVLVFSAGLGDVIALFLQFSKLYHDNMRIISNMMIFDENDKLVDFTSPIIHSFNKRTSIVPNEAESKSCAILLGDSTGDVHMAQGFDTVLKIGFLNNHAEEYLKLYQSIYDIVLINVDSFEIPLNIIQAILE